MTKGLSNQDATSAQAEWLLIGRVVGPHGLNGHVKVYPESDFPERFTTPGERWIRRANQPPETVQITSGRFLEGKNLYLVKLEGVDYRDQSEALRGVELLVPAADRLPLDPGEFHVDDLVGLAVVHQETQQTIGTITNVFTTGHDLLEVTLPRPALTEESGPKSWTDESASPTPEANNRPASKPDKLSDTSLRTKARNKLRRKEKRAQKKKQQQLNAAKTLLIPFVEEIVPVVDVTGGKIEITPPDGLIDL